MCHRRHGHPSIQSTAVDCDSLQTVLPPLAPSRVSPASRRTPSFAMKSFKKTLVTLQPVSPARLTRVLTVAAVPSLTGRTPAHPRIKTQNRLPVPPPLPPPRSMPPLLPTPQSLSPSQVPPPSQAYPISPIITTAITPSRPCRTPLPLSAPFRPPTRPQPAQIASISTTTRPSPHRPSSSSAPRPQTSPPPARAMPLPRG